MEVNKIYCMDCLEGMKQISDETIDLILTDPPYNTGMSISSSTGKTRRFNNKHNNYLGNFFDDDYADEDYLNLIQKVCINLFRVLKNNKAGYIFMNWKKLGLWIDELTNVGFKVKNVIIWDKVVHGLNYQNYAYTHELIIFFVKGNFFPNNKQEKYYKDVWNIQREINNFNDKEHHETVKNIKVVRLPIIHASNEGDLILDPFIGSGTTAVACKQLGRNFIGFEKEEKYVDIANKRLAQDCLMNYFNKEEKNMSNSIPIL